MCWRRRRTLASSWNCWRATTPARTKWMPTSGCSAMRWPATRPCLRGRTMSKRPGGSLILCSRQARRSMTTSQGAGGRVKSTRGFHPLVGGITRGLRDRRRYAMRIGIATDHGGFHLKEELLGQLRAAGHEVVDFGAHRLSEDDDYPDYVVPLARAVAALEVERGVAICGSGVGASVCANKVQGIRAALIHDHFSARQGVEDDHLNILCMGGRTVGPAVAWDLVQTFLAATFSQTERHLRRLGKVAAVDAGKA